MSLAKVARKLRLGGKVAVQFRITSTFECIHLTCKELWRPDRLRVIWLRSHRSVQSLDVEWVTTEERGPDGADGKATFDPPVSVSLIVTLYRDHNATEFDSKEYKYYIENNSPGGKKILASFQLDVSQYVDVTIPHSKQPLDCHFKPISHKISHAYLGVTLETELSCQGTAQDGDMQSTFSSLEPGKADLVFDEEDDDEEMGAHAASPPPTLQLSKVVEEGEPIERETTPPAEVEPIENSGHSEDAKLGEIDSSDLDFGDQLAVGQGTAVYKGRWISRNLTVAIKQVGGRIREEEAEIHSQLHHRNVIEFHGVVKRKPEYYLIMEFADRGSLYDLLHKQHHHPDFALSLKWAKEIAEGMKYLHQRKVIHRDLKSQNVLLMADETVKLCDFGVSKEFGITKTGTQVGTFRWMAPEILRKEPVSLSCDVFSYGMVLLELLTCEVPFSEATNLGVISKIMEGETPSIPDSCEPYLARLLKGCWSANPKDRPSFPEILMALDSGKAGVRQIDFTDLEFGDEVGAGVGSAIYKGRWISRDLVVAIKQVGGRINEAEAKIHNQLHHPNVIKLYGITKRRPDCYLIMEFADQGSLYDLLHKKHYQPELIQRLKWAKEIAEGMRYLHQKNIIHRDLKSPNVLLTTADQTVKLCDFGIATVFVSTKPGTEVGTYRWMAPEVMKEEPVSLSCDVFSYGMVLLELLTCDLPFAGVTAELSVVGKIMSGETPPIPDSCESYLAHLLKSCWSADPKERPSFSEILSILDNKAL